MEDIGKRCFKIYKFYKRCVIPVALTHYMSLGINSFGSKQGKEVYPYTHTSLTLKGLLDYKMQMKWQSGAKLHTFLILCQTW